jgi:hypothetical protein
MQELTWPVAAVRAVNAVPRRRRLDRDDGLDVELADLSQLVRKHPLNELATYPFRVALFSRILTLVSRRILENAVLRH